MEYSGYNYILGPDITFNGSYQGRLWQLSLQTDTCVLLYNISFNNYENLTETQPFGTSDWARCGDQEDDSEESKRFVLATGGRYSDPELNSTKPLAGNFTFLVCKATARLESREVRVATNGSVLDVVGLESEVSDDANANGSLSATIANSLLNSTLDSFYSAFAYIVYFNHGTAFSSLGADTPEVLPSDSSFSNWTWDRHNGNVYNYVWYFMNVTVPEPDPAAFMDTSLLTLAIRQATTLASTQFVNKYLLVDGDDLREIDGQLASNEQRLRVREVSLWLSEAILVLIVLIMAALLWIRPRGFGPSDTSTLAGLAYVLHQSPSLEQSLKGRNSLSSEALEASLSGQEYSALLQDYSVQATSAPQRASGKLSSKLESENQELVDLIEKPWRPWAFRLPITVAILAAPLCLVAALEAVYQHSEAMRLGLAVVDAHEYVRYTWVLIPAAVMTATRSLYSLVDFPVRLVAPYQQLKARPATAATNLNLNYLGLLTIISLIRSLRHKHWAVTATGLVMLVAPFLTIVVSGLYYTDAFSLELSSTIHYSNVLNTTVNFNDLNG